MATQLREERLDEEMQTNQEATEHQVGKEATEHQEAMLDKVGQADHVGHADKEALWDQADRVGR
jgi:hypothetical protein